MAFNLAREQWMFARRRTGAHCRIAPWQITDSYRQDAVVDLDFRRPDVDGAMVQFLIGLLQTAFAPKDEQAWRVLWDEPPSPETLREAFAKEHDAFVLDGHGPRFMQDKTLTPAEAGKPLEVKALFVDAPGGESHTDNTPVFNKPNRYKTLCPACAAAALFTLQTNAPSGGRGHRTSLRGGGPLTTLVLPAEPAQTTLWNLVWANVLPAQAIPVSEEAPGKTRAFGVYPWLAPTRISEKGEEIHPAEVDPLHAYWGMPRRIRLLFETGEATPCDLCGQGTETYVRTYLARHAGNNYSSRWKHPLSPYGRGKDDQWISLKGTTDGVGYRLWRGAVVSERQDKVRDPALVVAYALERRMPQIDPQAQTRLRIWAFGQDMDNMKNRSWAECLIPVLSAPKNAGMDADAYFNETKRLVLAAEAAADVFRAAVRVVLATPHAQDIQLTAKRVPREGKKAFVKLPKPLTPPDALAVRNAVMAFWTRTEHSFYTHINALWKAFDAKQEPSSVLEAWIECLRKESLMLFEDISARCVDWSKAPLHPVIAHQWLINQITLTNVFFAGKLHISIATAAKKNQTRPQDQPGATMADATFSGRKGEPHLWDTLAAWHKKLLSRETDRGLQAEMRRCCTPEEIMVTRGFQQLWRQLGSPQPTVDNMQRGLSLAVACGALAHVKDPNNTTLEFPVLLGLPRPGQTDPRMSLLRFQCLLSVKASEHTRLMMELIRAVHLADHTAHVASLAQGAMHWNEATRRRWTFLYYGADNPLDDTSGE